MGLPVLTCAGNTFPSRVAGSLLTAIGLSELVTHNLEDYYQLALNLSTNRDVNEAIRSKLIASRDSGPLFDNARFTRDLENIYIALMNRSNADSCLGVNN